MEKHVIFEKVKEIICDICGFDLRTSPVRKDQISLDSNLKNDLGLDSLSLSELIMELEKEFQITFSDQEPEEWKTVGNIVESIQNKL